MDYVVLSDNLVKLA